MESSSDGSSPNVTNEEIDDLTSRLERFEERFVPDLVDRNRALKFAELLEKVSKNISNSFVSPSNNGKETMSTEQRMKMAEDKPQMFSHSVPLKRRTDVTDQENQGHQSYVNREFNTAQKRPFGNISNLDEKQPTATSLSSDVKSSCPSDVKNIWQEIDKSPEVQTTTHDGSSDKTFSPPKKGRYEDDVSDDEHQSAAISDKTTGSEKKLQQYNNSFSPESSDIEEEEENQKGIMSSSASQQTCSAVAATVKQKQSSEEQLNGADRDILRRHAIKVIPKKPERPKGFTCGMGYTGYTEEEKSHTKDVIKKIEDSIPNLKTKRDKFYFMAGVVIHHIDCHSCKRCSGFDEEVTDGVGAPKYIRQQSSSSGMSGGVLLTSSTTKIVAVEVIVEHVKKGLKDKFAVLKNLFENNLDDVKAVMISAEIVGNVSNVNSFEVISKSFLAGFDFLTTQKEVQNWCLKFFCAFKKLGGPFSLAASNVRDHIQSTVAKELSIEFTLSFESLHH